MREGLPELLLASLLSNFAEMLVYLSHYLGLNLRVALRLKEALRKARFENPLCLLDDSDDQVHLLPLLFELRSLLSPLLVNRVDLLLQLGLESILSNQSSLPLS